MKKLGMMMVAMIAMAALLLPGVAAQPPVKTDGFVCPVITTSAVMNSPNGAAIGGGHYTIVGPDVSVPVLATNGEGAGTPPGPHSEPGDTDYTAIWAG